MRVGQVRDHTLRKPGCAWYFYRRPIYFRAGEEKTRTDMGKPATRHRKSMACRGQAYA